MGVQNVKIYVQEKKTIYEGSGGGEDGIPPSCQHKKYL